MATPAPTALSMVRHECCPGMGSSSISRPLKTITNRRVVQVRGTCQPLEQRPRSSLADETGLVRAASLRMRSAGLEVAVEDPGVGHMTVCSSGSTMTCAKYAGPLEWSNTGPLRSLARSTVWSHPSLKVRYSPLAFHERLECVLRSILTRWLGEQPNPDLSVSILPGPLGAPPEPRRFELALVGAATRKAQLPLHSHDQAHSSSARHRRRRRGALSDPLIAGRVREKAGSARSPRLRVELRFISEVPS
jgi:hypothetical protein